MAHPFLIFIIDDDKLMQTMLQDFVLTKYDGATVQCFLTGEEAIMELYKKPDVILLDYHLDTNIASANNGLEILKRIKQLIHSIPVIFITSQEDTKTSADIIKYGAYDYIVKGENAFNRLEIMINNSTGHISLQKQLKTQKFFNIFLILLFVAIVLVFLMQMIND
jgi:two-component system OmpR family response regulator